MVIWSISYQLSSPGQHDAQANQTYSSPAHPTDSLLQYKLCPQRANGIAEGCCRNDKTHGSPGKQHQRGVKRHGHQGNAQPEPARAQCPFQKLKYLARQEPMRFADIFHSIGDRDLASRAGEYYDGQESSYSDTHGNLLLVRGSVRPTRVTPKQIKRTPAQRASVTFSRRIKTLSKATTAYPNEVEGMT